MYGTVSSQIAGKKYRPKVFSVGMDWYKVFSAPGKAMKCNDCNIVKVMYEISPALLNQ